MSAHQQLYGHPTGTKEPFVVVFVFWTMIGSKPYTLSNHFRYFWMKETILSPLLFWRRPVFKSNWHMYFIAECCTSLWGVISADFVFAVMIIVWRPSASKNSNLTPAAKLFMVQFRCSMQVSVKQNRWFELARPAPRACYGCFFL